MDFIRTMVSDKRTRYVDNDYNLDLTYITSRIIATSFPACGIESLYRNDIDTLDSFLRNRHKEGFKIYNLSDREYGKIIGDWNIYHVHWLDHHPISFVFYVDIILDSAKTLREDEKVAIVVHCLSGKGRTGMLVCALLFYYNICLSIEGANQIFKERRGVAVEHPSQLRYMKYFETMINCGVEKTNVNPKVIKGMSISFLNSQQSSFETLEVKVYDFLTESLLTVFTFSLNTIDESKSSVKDSSKLPEIKSEDSEEDRYVTKGLSDRDYETPTPDLFIKIFSERIMSNFLGRVNVNTFFIPDNKIELCLSDFDQNSGLPSSFRLSIELSDFTQITGKSLPYSYLRIREQISMVKNNQPFK